jgi:membrane protease YdiL (CAAX protease family)
MEQTLSRIRVGLHPYLGAFAVLVLCASAAPPLTAQQGDTLVRSGEARRGSEFLTPLGSWFLPGLGQYIERAPLAGVAYSATALAGMAVSLSAGDVGWSGADPLPRDAGDQFAFQGMHVQQTAGFLSGWDAFSRAVPALQAQGRYDFLTTPESVGDLLTAPFDVRFLSRPTTWLHLAYTGVITAIVLGERNPGTEYEPFHPRDAAFLTAMSFNAGVGEEAAFRGWLMPVLYQNSGQRFWLSNTVQAGIFGGLHAATAREFAAVIGGWALYEGWLTRRNDWSIRESIFHHFWYDVAVVTAILLADERAGPMQLTFPTIRF